MCRSRDPVSTEHKEELDMRGNDSIGIVGSGLVIAGVVFCMADPKLFDHWYDWLFGPFFLIAGSTLVLAWIWGRLYALKPTYRKHRRSSGFIQAAESAGAPIQWPGVEQRHQERRREYRRKADVA
jgi:hypothetical protein